MESRKFPETQQAEVGHRGFRGRESRAWTSDKYRGVPIAKEHKHPAIPLANELGLGPALPNSRERSTSPGQNRFCFWQIVYVCPLPQKAFPGVCMPLSSRLDALLFYARANDKNEAHRLRRVALEQFLNLEPNPKPKPSNVSSPAVFA